MDPQDHAPSMPKSTPINIGRRTVSAKPALLPKLRQVRTPDTPYEIVNETLKVVTFFDAQTDKPVFNATVFRDRQGLYQARCTEPDVREQMAKNGFGASYMKDLIGCGLLSSNGGCQAKLIDMGEGLDGYNKWELAGGKGEPKCRPRETGSVANPKWLPKDEKQARRADKAARKSRTEELDAKEAAGEVVDRGETARKVMQSGRPQIKIEFLAPGATDPALVGTYSLVGGNIVLVSQAAVDHAADKYETLDPVTSAALRAFSLKYSEDNSDKFRVTLKPETGAAIQPPEMMTIGDVLVPSTRAKQAFFRGFLFSFDGDAEVVPHMQTELKRQQKKEVKNRVKARHAAADAAEAEAEAEAKAEQGTLLDDKNGAAKRKRTAGGKVASGEAVTVIDDTDGGEEEVAVVKPKVKRVRRKNDDPREARVEYQANPDEPKVLIADVTISKHRTNIEIQITNAMISNAAKKCKKSAPKASAWLTNTLMARDDKTTRVIGLETSEGSRDLDQMEVNQELFASGKKSEHFCQGLIISYRGKAKGKGKVDEGPLDKYFAK